MSSLNYIQNTDGTNFIPSSQRPDGTWRKPIKVKDGYVPVDEQPLYVSKGKQSTTHLNASAPDFIPSSSKALYFEVGQYKPATIIPGLNFIESSNDKVVYKKKKSKKPKTTEGEVQSKAPKESPIQSLPVDPIKRLRNLKKKLKDIEGLESKVNSGELKNPEKDQMEKIKRKREVEDEIYELETCIVTLNSLTMSF